MTSVYESVVNQPFFIVISNNNDYVGCFKDFKYYNQLIASLYLDKDIKGMKLALPKEFLGDDVDESVTEAVLKAKEYFESLGAIVEEVEMIIKQKGNGRIIR